MEFPHIDQEVKSNTDVTTSRSSTLVFPSINREARSNTGRTRRTRRTTRESFTRLFPRVNRRARSNNGVIPSRSSTLLFPRITRTGRSYAGATSSTKAANPQLLVSPTIGPQASMPGPPTSFHFFPLLPDNLQDYIWELAIDVDAPRGYNVGFTKSKHNHNLPTITWGLRKLMQKEDPSPGPCNRTRNVMATGLRAAIVVRQEWQSWQPVVPFWLEDRSTADPPYDMVKKESPGSRRIKVDASRDLMLIPKIGISKANYNAPEIYLPHEIVGHRFEWLCKNEPVLLSTRLQDMLRLCPVARVCYVVIHDMPYFRAQGVDALFETLGRGDLEWYRKQHELVEPQTSSMTYQIGNRIYYEIKIEDFPLTQDLRLILGEMRFVENWYRTDYQRRLAFRLMTWRLA